MGVSVGGKVGLLVCVSIAVAVEGTAGVDVIVGIAIEISLGAGRSSGMDMAH